MQELWNSDVKTEKSWQAEPLIITVQSESLLTL
jgi:hypothetical protein